MDRSAVKKAYKESKRPMGVYGIRNLQGHGIFIGVAIDLEARFNRHKAELKFGSHRNRELQKIWNVYGESALVFEILDVLDQEDGATAGSGEELEILAEMWIEKLENAGGPVVRI